MEAAQQRDPLLLAGLRPRGKCAFRRGDRGTGVVNVTQAHRADHLFGRRVEKLEPFGAVRRDEGAVDIDLVDVKHGRSPNERRCSAARLRV
ncbi:hypothetical protein D3C87_1572090 [compost metagenome]